jgi:Helix-turn-helix domain
MNQKAILMAWLHEHGRTSCADLEKVCDVRSVTTRMSELIRKGAAIVKADEWEPNSRGKLRRVTYYDLKRETPQGELFTPA